MMKKGLSVLVFVALLLSAGLVSAHMGHGDHTAIFSSGEFHPLISLEQILLISASVASAVLAVLYFRR